MFTEICLESAFVSVGYEMFRKNITIFILSPIIVPILSAFPSLVTQFTGGHVPGPGLLRSLTADTGDTGTMVTCVRPELGNITDAVRKYLYQLST